MAIKKVLLSKKINNVIYDVFPKTDAGIVVYGETTVAATLAQFAEDLANVYTQTDADAAIKASCDELYNKIMGITGEEGETIAEAYDTLKEVAKWIDEHGDVAAAFTTDIAALKTAVGDENSGLVKAMADAQAAIESNDDDIAELQEAVTALETAVGDAESGLVKDVADLKTTVGNAESGLVKDVADLQTTVGDAESGLVKAVADLEAKATQVVASETNGNVVVDGQEVTVYVHPETHPATMIVEDDDHMFVTAAEKASIADSASIVVVASQDEVVNEMDLYLVEIQ